MTRYSIIKSDGYIDRATSDLQSYNITALFKTEKTKLKFLAFGGKEKTYQSWNGINENTYKINRKFNSSGAIYQGGNIVKFYDNETDNYQQNHYHLILNQNISNHWDLETTLHYTKGKGFFKIIPFLFAIIGGYVFAVCLGLVDFNPVLKANWFEIPGFYLPFNTGGAFKQYNLYFGPETIAILPIAIVTISEHIGDHTVLSQICGRQFLKQPGLHRTLLGDGIATSVSAFLGGPANTTYGENTGVIGMTRIASVSVIRNAALIALSLSFLGKFTALISTIPNSVLGGMSILLYGVIASNGLKVLIKERVDFSLMRNLIIASAMLVLGLGGATLKLGPVTLAGTALSAMTGIILNLILPHESN